MKVRFRDNGQVVEVPNDKELVSWMRRNAFSGDETNGEYMLSYARRAVISDDEDIRATSEREFVADLLRLHHIEIL